MVSKKRKFFAASFRAIAIDDRLSDASLHFLGLAAQHRGLIGHADRLQMHIGIEAGANARRGICPETPACRRRAGCNRKRNRYPPA